MSVVCGNSSSVDNHQGKRVDHDHLFIRSASEYLRSRKGHRMMERSECDHPVLPPGFLALRSVIALPTASE